MAEWVTLVDRLYCNNGSYELALTSLSIRDMKQLVYAYLLHVLAG